MGTVLKLTVGVAAKAPYLLEDADLDSLTIQVGGHTAKPKTIYYGGGYAHESVEKNGVWYWVFVVPDAFTVPAYTFSEIDFALDSVEEGGHPDMTADVTGSGTLPFSKMNTSIEWTDLGTNGSGNTAMTASSTFQNGHYYECRVRFTTSDPTNYKFPGADAGMTITANGKTIPETMSNPYESPLVSCFAYGIDGETGSACYTVYLRFNIGNGSTVSGTAVSWNNTDNAVYLLYNSSVSDTDIKADMKLASPEKALAYTAVKGGITQNADGKRYDQTFSFSTVPAGTYKLAIFKPGGYIVSIAEIVVDAIDVEQDAELILKGDIKLDGVIDSKDLLLLKRNLSNSTKYPLEGNALLAADLREDDVIDSKDLLVMKRYLSNSSKYPIS